MFYGMPIHIIRDVALTIRSFYKRITDFMKYRHATRDMNSRYPDATADEIGDENVCIICREVMRPWQPVDLQAGNEGSPVASHIDERLRPKKLPCGHILHFACLRSWLERQQNCPICRQPVLTSSPTLQTPVITPEQARAQAQHNLDADEIPQLRVNQQRIRFFNFGPFRLGFGAGQDLRRLGEQAREPAPLEAQQAPARSNTFAHRPGSGPGLGRQQMANNDFIHAPFSPTAVQHQLQSVEQQLVREMQSLRLQADQLNTLLVLQAELARLRAARSFPDADDMTNVGQSSPQLHLPTHTTTQLLSVDARRERTVQAHNMLPGVTVPEGWTLVPLRRLPLVMGNAYAQSPSGVHNGSTFTREAAFQLRSSAQASANLDEIHQRTTRSQSPPAPTPANSHASSMPLTGQVQTTDSTSRGTSFPSQSPDPLYEKRSEMPAIERRSDTSNDVRGTRDRSDFVSQEAQTSQSTTNWPLGMAPAVETNVTPQASVTETGEMLEEANANHTQAKGKGRATTVEDVEESE